MEDLSKLTKQQLIDRLGATESGFATLDEGESELDKLNRMSSDNNPNAIPFSRKNDHKNVMLYTALNKRIGPLHPDNARTTMMRWKKAGYQLFLTKRTDEQVELFKQTDLYKREHAKHEATRKLRRQQSSKGKTEQLVENVASAVAKGMQGVNNNV